MGAACKRLIAANTFCWREGAVDTDHAQSTLQLACSRDACAHAARQAHAAYVRCMHASPSVHALCRRRGAAGGHDVCLGATHAWQPARPLH